MTVFCKVDSLERSLSRLVRVDRRWESRDRASFMYDADDDDDDDDVEHESLLLFVWSREDVSDDVGGEEEEEESYIDSARR
mmetsp:Transcript_29246/g.53953  ORF Transcript_29246/g.53953 Transcript_29246/m.53953 type:complete len:81 (-) Transcript_29246:99-341(-)